MITRATFSLLMEIYVPTDVLTQNSFFSLHHNLAHHSSQVVVYTDPMQLHFSGGAGQVTWKLTAYN